MLVFLYSARQQVVGESKVDLCEILPAEFSADMCTVHFFEHGCFILLGKV